MKKKALNSASSELSAVLHHIPYLKDVIMGGELAKMAFDYLKENTP